MGGRDGNTAAPINCDTYYVTELGPDGGLTVAPIIAGSPGLTNGARLNHLLAVIAADHSLAVRARGG